MGIGFRCDSGENRSDLIGRDLGRGGGCSICYKPMRRNGSVVWVQHRLYSKYTHV
jgi:hypothetical protein